MDMRCAAWNVRNHCRAGSLKTAASEVVKCKLNLVAVQEVRWNMSGNQPAHDYTFFLWKWVLIVT
jgi:hypothetical protein